MRFMVCLFGLALVVARLEGAALAKGDSVAQLREQAQKLTSMTLSNAVMDVSLDPKTGALAITDKRIPHTYATLPAQGVIVVGAQRRSPLIGDFRLYDLANDAYLTATLSLGEDKPVFECIISTNTAGAMRADLAFPPPLRNEPGDWLVIPLNEGILYPVDEADVAPPKRLPAYAGQQVSMPWFGVTDMKRGVATLVATPDDMAMTFGRDEAGRLYVSPVWAPSRGGLRYSRHIFYALFDTGGYVALAKAYRTRLASQGRLKSLKRKLEENPTVDRFIGAPDVWTSGLDPVEVAKGLREGGVERLLFCFHGGPIGKDAAAATSATRERARQVEAIKGLGYVVTRYDSYRTAYAPGKPENAPRHYRSPDELVRERDGSPRKGWAMKRKDGDYQGYEVCSPLQLAEARETIPADTAKSGYQGRFIDTTTAAPLMECYSDRHPLSRSDDKLAKTLLLELVSRHNHLIAGSETGSDWAAPAVHYFEGMMSLSPYRVPDAGRNMYQYAKPTEGLLKYQVGPRYRVPLWELVYHDSVVAYWYWGDGSNKQPELWNARDLWNILYATPPLWMIDKEKWASEKERFLKSYGAVCPVVRKAAYQTMTNHEFLTPDHTVQRTTFSGGLRVTVNFGGQPFTNEKGATVAAKGYLVEEPQ